MTDRNPGSNSVAADVLRGIVERIERVEDEISMLQGDRKDIFAEAKGQGFDVPALRRLIKLRQMDQVERQRLDDLVDLYEHAMGDAK